jgi:hypothetical protein
MNGEVWGTMLYTDDSSICHATLHAGIVGPEGGIATTLRHEGEFSYSGSNQNDVISRDYGPWSGSFILRGPPDLKTKKPDRISGVGPLNFVT